MKKERAWKFNIVDVIVLLVIIAAVVFFAWRSLFPEKEEPPVMQVIRYDVEVPGMTRDMYEEVAALIPCQMAASGHWVNGYIRSVDWEPCQVEYIEASSPVNPNETQWIKADPDTEYVTAVFHCEANIEAGDMFNTVGTQEIRVGRSHYLKSVDIELIGTIRSLEKSAS